MLVHFTLEADLSKTLSCLIIDIWHVCPSLLALIFPQKVTLLSRFYLSRHVTVSKDLTGELTVVYLSVIRVLRSQEPRVFFIVHFRLCNRLSWFLFSFGVVGFCR